MRVQQPGGKSSLVSLSRMVCTEGTINDIFSNLFLLVIDPPGNALSADKVSLKNEICFRDIGLCNCTINGQSRVHLGLIIVLTVVTGLVLGGILVVLADFYSKWNYKAPKVN